MKSEATDAVQLDIPNNVLRQVAFCSANPSSWASTTSSANATINQDADFELEWFLRWQPILLPHRPWQYAVLTWRRMQGAEPRRVAQFVLRILQAKQQQTDEQQQPAPPAADPASMAGENKYAEFPCFEGQFGGVYPNLHPLPSTLRKVRKLLAKQEAAADLHALLLLCPCPIVLLGQYAGRDATPPSAAAFRLQRDMSSSASSSSVLQPMPLLQRLMQHVHVVRDRTDFSRTYSSFMLESSRYTKGISTHRLCCFAALAVGHVPQLLLLLSTDITQFQWSQASDRTLRQVLLRKLLRYAIRNSNADCVRAVLMHFDAMHRPNVLAPQHLAMAAGRTDPWAPGVVTLLIQLLHSKQLKPSHMRPAYKAAAVAGHVPVLALLLRHAASAPTQHLPVLFEVVANSGNLGVAELLLGATAAAVLRLHEYKPGQQQQWQQLQDEVQSSVQLLRAACADLSVESCMTLLGSVLPKLEFTSSMMVQANWGAADTAVQLFGAEQLWRLLPQATQLRLQDAGMRAPEAFRAACSTVATAWGLQLGRSLEVKLSNQLHFGRTARTTMFLIQRRLLPAANTLGPVADDTWLACKKALQSGLQAHTALQLHRLASAQQGAAQRLSSLSPLGTAMAVIWGRLSAACAACDAAAVPQLEQLYMLCYMLLIPPALLPGKPAKPATTTSIAPTLPISLAGGRVVTVAHLAAGLGLPWGLLGTLLAAAGYDKLGQVRSAAPAGAEGASSGGSSNSQGKGRDSSNSQGKGRDSSSAGISAMLLDAILAVDMPAAAKMQGVFRIVNGVDMADWFNPMPHPSARGRPNDNPVQHYIDHGFDLLMMRQDGRPAQDDQQRRQQFMARGRQQAGFLEHMRSAFDADVKQLESQQFKQDQKRSPPLLWQQALLQLVAQDAPVLRLNCIMMKQHGRTFPQWAGLDPAPELYSGTTVLLHGLQAGRSAQEVRDFISAVLLGRPSTSAQSATDAQPAAAGAIALAAGASRGGVEPAQVAAAIAGLCPPSFAPWGPQILRHALFNRAPELLAWSLQPEQQQVLWGWDTDAVDRVVHGLARTEGLSPISCRCTSQLYKGEHSATRSLLSRYCQQVPQQQQDLAEMQQQRELLLGLAGAINSSGSFGPMVCAAGPEPGFAASAVQLALPLLQHPAAAPDTLSSWLRYTVGASSTLADLVRARAVVAAVARADVIPPGAKEVQKEAVRQVLAVGDPDLWSVVLLWSHRLPVQLGDVTDEEPGVPVDGDWDDVDDGVGELQALFNAGLGFGGFGIEALAAGVDADNI